MTSLPSIMFAPNGARPSKKDHPEVPISEDEIVSCAVDCFAAGAGAIHVHIRDESGQHLLDAKAYASVVQKIRAAAPEMMVQITTEAAGRYEPIQQMQVALGSGASHLSVSIREISKATSRELSDFLERCTDNGIALQWILYDVGDAETLQSNLPQSTLRSSQLQLLFVLGKYDQVAGRPEDLHPFLEWMSAAQVTPDWAVCAFGEHEPACLVYAASKGGKCRTGFENSFRLSNGEIARSNSEKVRDLRMKLGLPST